MPTLAQLHDQLQALTQAVILRDYNPDQPRDANGRFGAGSGKTSGFRQWTSPQPRVMSPAQLARARSAESKSGKTFQCMRCSKMLNGPMRGQKLGFRIPNDNQLHTFWAMTLCPSCMRTIYVHGGYLDRMIAHGMTREDALAKINAKIAADEAAAKAAGDRENRVRIPMMDTGSQRMHASEGQALDRLRAQLAEMQRYKNQEIVRGSDGRIIGNIGTGTGSKSTFPDGKKGQVVRVDIVGTNKTRSGNELATVRIITADGQAYEKIVPHTGNAKNDKMAALVASGIPHERAQEILGRVGKDSPSKVDVAAHFAQQYRLEEDRAYQKGDTVAAESARQQADKWEHELSLASKERYALHHQNYSSMRTEPDFKSGMLADRIESDRQIMHEARQAFSTKTSSGTAKSSGGRKSGVGNASIADLHAASRAWQAANPSAPREAHLEVTSPKGAVVKTDNIQPITSHIAHEFNPYAPPDPHFLAQLYGEHQLGAALDRLSGTRTLNEIAKGQGIAPGATRAETISRITAHVTNGRYSYDFPTASAAKSGDGRKSGGAAARIAGLHEAARQWQAAHPDAPKETRPSASPLVPVHAGNAIAEYNPYLLVTSPQNLPIFQAAFGNHQIGALLSTQSLSSLRSGADALHLNSTGLRDNHDALVSLITSHVTDGHYAANFTTAKAGSGTKSASAEHPQLAGYRDALARLREQYAALHAARPDLSTKQTALEKAAAKSAAPRTFGDNTMRVPPSDRPRLSELQNEFNPREAYAHFGSDTLRSVLYAEPSGVLQAMAQNPNMPAGFVMPPANASKITLANAIVDHLDRTIGGTGTSNAPITREPDVSSTLMTSNTGALKDNFDPIEAWHAFGETRQSVYEALRNEPIGVLTQMLSRLGRTPRTGTASSNTFAKQIANLLGKQFGDTSVIEDKPHRAVASDLTTQLRVLQADWWPAA